ncbi:hypothetical protein TNCT_138421 [Trichonephila clavata]|uniref:Uncharacterized protein n=1 Tax=Trichonephila clavata TaxID=2740835 RepID=A0A8X6L5U3_TRICU|nr:hypothetical protein TNCT_138421 [Trichonephila clavata]
MERRSNDYETELVLGNISVESRGMKELKYVISIEDLSRVQLTGVHVSGANSGRAFGGKPPYSATDCIREAHNEDQVKLRFT